MEWLLPGGFGPEFTRADIARAVNDIGIDGPDVVDRWLIRVIYETVAAESSCYRCGAPLGAGLRVAVWSTGTASGWDVRVLTRCRGWRRHRYSALVRELPGGLHIGAFIPR